jgi:UDP-N-acetylmuramoyl-tripeptide--D-alanyl-D-alanine ligase
MDPVSLTDLAAATRAETAGLAVDAITVRQVCIDSRKVQPGDLFWALCGKKHDGHHFVAEALRRGAVASVVERASAVNFTSPLVVVGDTLAALGEFARWYRHQREAMVIGVTGSVGKTTTREMLHAVLSVRHTGRRSQRNFNNEIGLPLSLLDLAATDEFGVFEMGAARVGEIRQLCEIACPEVGVITRIGKAHLETFGSLEAIYEAKGELLDALPAHGFAVVAGDDEAMRIRAARALCPVIFVGEKPGNHVRAVDVTFETGRLKFSIDRRKYELAVPARHYLTAALCAFGVAREIGMEPGAIAEGFNRFVGEPGRCMVEQTGSCTVIDDTYNANPLSMQAACLCLGDWPGAGHKLLVVGDMLELGAETRSSHRDLGVTVASARVDRLLAFGEYAGHVTEGALHAGMRPHLVAECHELDALLTVLDCWLEPGDVVLVKGSRGMRMERVVQWLKQRGGQSRSENRLPTTARAVA